jgi:hypothetical protein
MPDISVVIDQLLKTIQEGLEVAIDDNPKPEVVEAIEALKYLKQLVGS